MQRRWKILEKIELVDNADMSVRVIIDYQPFKSMSFTIAKDIIEDIGRSSAIIGRIRSVLYDNDILLNEVMTVLRESYNIVDK